MTSSLVPVFTGQFQNQSTQLCNARDLHATLGVGRDFSNWIKGRIEEYGFTEGEDFCSPDLASKRRGRGGCNRTDYHLTLDMAKELAMVENNDQGRAVRRYFIQLEKQSRAANTPSTAITSKIDKDTQDRIARRAWALAQITFERYRHELTQAVEQNRLGIAIEEWAPAEARPDFIEDIEANADFLRLLSDALQNQAKMLAEMGGVNYEAIAAKFTRRTGSNA